VFYLFLLTWASVIMLSISDISMFGMKSTNFYLIRAELVVYVRGEWETLNNEMKNGVIRMSVV
jgi:hypothetical protein